MYRQQNNPNVWCDMYCVCNSTLLELTSICVHDKHMITSRKENQRACSVLLFKPESYIHLRGAPYIDMIHDQYAVLTPWFRDLPTLHRQTKIEVFESDLTLFAPAKRAVYLVDFPCPSTSRLLESIQLQRLHISRLSRGFQRI